MLDRLSKPLAQFPNFYSLGQEEDVVEKHQDDLDSDCCGHCHYPYHHFQVSPKLPVSFDDIGSLIFHCSVCILY